MILRRGVGVSDVLGANGTYGLDTKVTWQGEEMIRYLNLVVEVLVCGAGICFKHLSELFVLSGRSLSLDSGKIAG